MIQIDRRQATVAVVREVGEVGNGIVESGKIFKAMPLHRTFSPRHPFADGSPKRDINVTRRENKCFDLSPEMAMAKRTGIAIQLYC